MIQVQRHSNLVIAKIQENMDKCYNGEPINLGQFSYNEVSSVLYSDILILPYRLPTIEELKSMKLEKLDYMSSELIGNYVFYLGFNGNDREQRHTYRTMPLEVIILRDKSFSRY